MGTGRSTRRVVAVAAAIFGLGLATALTSAAASGIGGITLPLSTSSASSSSTSSTSSTHSSTSAGQPVASKLLLCGMWTPGTEPAAGKSNIDHPSGATATGSEFTYTGQTCESEYGNNSSNQFMWTISHSNVNTTTERGTEHGLFTLMSGGQEAGFNGHITDYDYPTSDCTSGNRVIYYASGHAYDSTGCPDAGSGPGNFNTHGGAATGQHFRGTYGTIVYQDQNNNNSPCQSGSGMYCFEGILQGQTN